MTKQEEPRGATLKTPWYKKAIVPWALICVIFAGAGGFIGGYTYHMNMSQEIKAQAHELVNLAQSKSQQ